MVPEVLEVSGVPELDPIFRGFEGPEVLEVPELHGFLRYWGSRRSRGFWVPRTGFYFSTMPFQCSFRKICSAHKIVFLQF